MPTLAEQQQLLKDYVRTNNPVPQGITSARLAPRTRVTLPTQNQPVPASGLQPAINSSIQSAKTQSEQDRADREASLTTQKSGLDKSIQDIMGLNEEIGNVENTVDRTAQDTAQKDADKYTSEIEAEQLAVRRKVENLQRNNPQGMLTGAVNDEINRFERESLSKQADLAILQNSALRNYSTAKEIADREVQNKLEPLKIKLENYKFFYQENKEIFNKQEERLYSEKIKEQERALQKQETLEKSIADIKIEAAKSGNSSIISALSQIDTTDPKAFDQALKIAAPVFASAANELTEVNGRKAIVNKNTGVVKYLDGGTGVTQRTVNGQPVEGKTLVAGDDPYFIAQEYGISVDQLKALNPNIQNWNNIQVGATLNVPARNSGKTQALETILGSAKFTKDQKASITQAITNGQDAFTVIKNQAKEIMGQTLATDLDKAEIAKQQLEAIDKSLKAFYNAGGETGVFKGNYEKTINKLGETKDPKLVGLATEIALAMQAYRLAVTGTAASVQEDARIDNVFPGITNGEVLNNARTQATINSFNTKIDAAYRNTLGSAYDTLKSNTVPPVDPIENIRNYGINNPQIRPTLIQMQNDGMTVEQINNWINQRQ